MPQPQLPPLEPASSATTEYFPEQTIRYKTYVKQTLVEALNTVMRSHPDEILQHTKASIEFPKTEADYPSIVIRFYENSVFNAGVGHQEIVAVYGESASTEVGVQVTDVGEVQLSWPPVANAAGYKIYKGRAPNQENQSFMIAGTTFTDNGTQGQPEAPPTEVTATLDPPVVTTVVGPGGLVSAGDYYYRVTAFEPSQAVKFQHYFYHADIEFAIYALSAYDRDLISDTLVQMIAMGRLEAYTNQFFERIYPSTNLYPDAQLHFININSDQIQGYGENQAETPWGAEDDLLYLTAYRVHVFGELYSLPPDLSYEIVRRVLTYPYFQDQPLPEVPGSTAAWVSNVP